MRRVFTLNSYHFLMEQGFKKYMFYDSVHTLLQRIRFLALEPRWIPIYLKLLLFSVFTNWNDSGFGCWKLQSSFSHHIKKEAFTRSFSRSWTEKSSRNPFLETSKVRFVILKIYKQFYGFNFWSNSSNNILVHKKIFQHLK